MDVIGGEAPESQPEADASGDGRDEREAINALSDLGVAIEVRRRSPRAAIEAVAVTWWRKEGDQFRETIRERERPKLGRRARLKAQIEASASTRLTG